MFSTNRLLIIMGRVPCPATLDGAGGAAGDKRIVTNVFSSLNPLLWEKLAGEQTRETGWHHVYLIS